MIFYTPDNPLDFKEKRPHLEMENNNKIKFAIVMLMMDIFAIGILVGYSILAFIQI